mmetsp:Transcript_21690/g.21848  ORF Transcript_21690/g.21848 Transcript_21690/m.21848 type:complete len:117 (+) Transcript_21690:376-726(+)
MHGKPSVISRVDKVTTEKESIEEKERERNILSGLPSDFTVARYHSLYGLQSNMPSVLQILAVTSDNYIMAIQHKSLPIAAVQFHPESILTLPKHGLQILNNALLLLDKQQYEEEKE